MKKLKQRIEQLEEKQRLWIGFALHMMQLARSKRLGEALSDLSADELPFFIARMVEWEKQAPSSAL